MKKINTNLIIPRTSQVCVLLPWSRSVVQIAWRALIFDLSSMVVHPNPNHPGLSSTSPGVGV